MINNGYRPKRCIQRDILFDVYLVFLFLFSYLGGYLEDGGQFACLDTYKIVIHVVATFIAFYRKKFQSEDMHN
jgi:hypothetical protein